MKYLLQSKEQKLELQKMSHSHDGDKKPNGMITLKGG